MIQSITLIMPTNTHFGQLPVFLQSVASGLLPGLSQHRVTLDCLVVDYSPNSDTLTAAMACHHMVPLRLLSVTPNSGLQGAILAGLHAVPPQHVAIVIDVAQGIDRVQTLLSALHEGQSLVQFNHPLTQNWQMGLSAETVQAIRGIHTLPLGPQWRQWWNGVTIPALGPPPHRHVINRNPSFRGPAYGLIVSAMGLPLGYWWPWVWGMGWVWASIMMVWWIWGVERWAHDTVIPAYRLSSLPLHLQRPRPTNDPSIPRHSTTARRRRSRHRRGSQTPGSSSTPPPPSD